jgi:hypothetical protein
MGDGIHRYCCFRGDKAEFIVVNIEMGLISQHLHLNCSPRRGPLNPLLTTRLVCDLPLQVACICTYTESAFDKNASAVTAHVRALYQVFCRGNDLFELAGAQYESESLPSGSRAPVYV